MISLDQTDLKILNLLQKDAKQTHKGIADQVNLSVTAVYERIKKMEKNQIIKAHTIEIDHKLLERNFMVLCHVKLIHHKQDMINDFEKQVKNLDEVLECFHVSGDYDYILKVFVKDMDAFREFMVKKLTNLNHIGSTHSSFVINQVKNSRIHEL
jgi:Lrp/AsnC family leucine-responsive transcriptional regulator